MKLKLKRSNTRPYNTSTLPSDVVKNPTDRLHKRVIVKIREKREKSPKLFIISLISILVIFGLLIIGFVALQSQGATEANIYRSKTGEYLEAVYNASTIASDNPSEIANKIESIKPPQLGFLPLGIFSYSYVSAQMLQNDIANQVNGLISVVKANGQFYDFYNRYTSTIGEIANLSYGRGSDKLESLLSAKSKYKDLEENVSAAKLPDELQTSQNKLKEDLTAAGEAVDGLATTLKNGDNSGYALSSYRYSLVSDKLLSDFADMRDYNGQIKQRLKLASQHFNDFRGAVR